MWVKKLVNNSFIEKMAKLYQAVPSPLLVSIRIAQACLESHYGNSDLAREANNYAGIKATPPWQGETYTKTTKEEIDGVLVDVEGERFRKYKTIQDFIVDHSNFVVSTDKRKDFYANVINATTFVGQAGALTGTYATDSRYGAKLIELNEAYNLEQYDHFRIDDKGIHINSDNIKLEGYNMQIVDRRKKALGYPGHGYYPRRNKNAIKNIVWHYTWSDHNGDAEQVIQQHEAYWRRTHGWDLGGYHYYIDKKGKIVQNYDLEVVSYGAGRANPYCVHISLESKGNYTQAQIKARDWLTRKLMKELGLPASAVKGHKEMPNNTTNCPGYSIAQLDQFRKELATTVTPQATPQYFDLPIKEGAKPFDELKVGQTVTIREGHGVWYVPNRQEFVKASRDFKGDKDVIEQVMTVNAGYSKRAYLLKNKRSWILEQDLVEARNSWVAIPIKDDGTDKGEVKLEQDKPYVYIDGAYYDLVKR